MKEVNVLSHKKFKNCISHAKRLIKQDQEEYISKTNTWTQNKVKRKEEAGPSIVTSVLPASGREDIELRLKAN